MYLRINRVGRYLGDAVDTSDRHLSIAICAYLLRKCLEITIDPKDVQLSLACNGISLGNLA